MNNIKVPEEFKKLDAHFNKLLNLPQPEQRTKEWFNYRNSRITASDTATAIDMNPYEPLESFIINKCIPNPFHDNEYVYHGKKYEEIATLYYQHLYNTKVTEFGCLPSEKYDFLGASPDGICSNSTLDGKFSEMLGVMLEIKCPFTRNILTKGPIIGHICPFYYYCQVQQQLECCDLNRCDFWQCKIVEYESREEFLNDKKFNPKITFGTEGELLEFNKVTAKGCLIQLLPFKFEKLFEEDLLKYKAKFIYPTNLNMNQKELDKWIADTIDNWKIKYPQWADDHYFDKVLYWKIPKSHNVSIMRDKEWFSQVYPILKDTWEKVKYYRKNLDKIEDLQKIVDKKKKFYMKTDFKISNFNSNKTLFLDLAPKSNSKITFLD